MPLRRISSPRWMPERKSCSCVRELRPQVMGQAALAVVAVLLALAFRDVQWFIHREDDVGDADAVHVTGQHVAASRPPGADDQVAALHLGKQLLKIRQGNALII